MNLEDVLLRFGGVDHICRRTIRFCFDNTLNLARESVYSIRTCFYDVEQNEKHMNVYGEEHECRAYCYAFISCFCSS